MKKILSRSAALFILPLSLSGCAVLEPKPVRMDVSCIVLSSEPFVLNCADAETWQEWRKIRQRTDRPEF